MKAILFDLDGVLIDTLDWHYQSFARALSLFGYTLSREEHDEIYDGLPTTLKLKLLTKKRGFPKSLHPFLSEMKQTYTRDVIEKQCRPNSELRSLLKGLKGRGYKLGVASNSIKETIERILRKSDIDSFFDVVLSAEDVGRAKPDPKIYLEAMKRLDVTSGECLIVEDSAPGLEAARASGARILEVGSPKEVTIENILKALQKPAVAAGRKIEILIPMAGLGTRFQKAGYTKPKPFIDVLDRPMIQWVIENVTPKTCDARFTFVCHVDQQETVERELLKLVPDANIAVIPGTTEGAACTALLGLDLIDKTAPLLIANSDQWVDTSIDTFLLAAKNLDGLIMTFPAKDKKWSYAKTDAKGRVVEVAEKNPISPHATVGIYYFERGQDFVEAAQSMIRKDLRVNGEFYVCPVYNELIKVGKTVGIFEIPEKAMNGLGTPEDLETFLQTYMHLPKTA